LHPYFSPVAHRGSRIIDTDLRISQLLHVSSDNQEGEEGSEDNPNVNAHHSRPATALPVKQLGVAAVYGQNEGLGT